MLNLILDLDQTLIDSRRFDTKCKECFETRQMALKDPHYMVSFVCSTKKKPYDVFARPLLYEFLNEIGKYYNLYVFTQSTREYAIPIVEHIQSKINHRIINIWTKNEHQYKAIRFTGLDPHNTYIFDDKIDVWLDGHTNIVNAVPFRSIYSVHNIHAHDSDDYLGYMLDVFLEKVVIHRSITEPNTTMDIVADCTETHYGEYYYEDGFVINLDHPMT